jgi:hypothetical protein
MTLAVPDTRAGNDVAQRAARLRGPRFPAPERWLEIRLAANKTLREVAEEVGVDAMTIWRWEQRRSKPWRRHMKVYGPTLLALEEVGRQLQAERKSAEQPSK